MKGVPATGKVDRTLALADLEVKAAVRRVADRAAKLSRRGKFAQAEQVLRVAREVEAFRLQLRVLRKQWRGSGAGSNSPSGRSERTPLWGYYELIAQTVAGLGGDADRGAIEEALANEAGDFFKPGDLELVAGGEARWKLMLRRARRPMIREGYLAPKTRRWRLTAEGARLARDANVARPA